MCWMKKVHRGGERMNVGPRDDGGCATRMPWDSNCESFPQFPPPASLVSPSEPSSEKTVLSLVRWGMLCPECRTEMFSTGFHRWSNLFTISRTNFGSASSRRSPWSYELSIRARRCTGKIVQGMASRSSAATEECVKIVGQ